MNLFAGDVHNVIGFKGRDFSSPSERLICELTVYTCSGVRRRRRCQPFSNISSKTAWPIKAKFYVEPHWEGRTKVYINGPGHMTKMAAMPIYLKIFISRTIKPLILKLGM